jgi:hypothetical protein
MTMPVTTPMANWIAITVDQRRASWKATASCGAARGFMTRVMNGGPRQHQDDMDHGEAICSRAGNIWD